jgi:CRP/FNR family transcriptional regulator, dissimilatory nitrate respiration regulator
VDLVIENFSRLLAKKTAHAALSKKCSKGVFLFREGTKYLGPWLLEKGTLVLVKSSTSGKEQVVRQIEPGEVFCEVPIFRNVDWYPINARCSTACDLALLPVEHVKAALRNDPELAWAASCALAARITEFRDIVFDLTLTEAKQRLLRYLLRKLAGRTNASLGVVRLGMSHQDLALLLGIRPESLSRALTDLETAGKMRRLSRQTFQLVQKNIERVDHEL